jgi:hypothetical protein
MPLEQIHKDRLLAVADAVETSPTFDMTRIFWGWNGRGTGGGHPCGTAACIAGHAEVLRLGKRLVTPDDYRDPVVSDRFSEWENARQWLGLSVLQADELFMPVSSEYYDDFDDEWPNRIDQDLDYERDEITGAHAARVIREFVATEGPIVW